MNVTTVDRAARKTAAGLDQFKRDLEAMKVGDKTDSDRAMCKALDAKRFTSEGQVRNRHMATIASAAEYHLCFDPKYWRTQALKLTRGDVVVVRDDFGTFEAELRVMEVNHVGADATMQEYYRKDFVPFVSAGAERDEFEVRDLGHHLGYAVFNKATGKEMRAGFKTKELARDYMNTDLRVVVTGMGSTSILSAG